MALGRPSNETPKSSVETTNQYTRCQANVDRAYRLLGTLAPYFSGSCFPGLYISDDGPRSEVSCAVHGCQHVSGVKKAVPKWVEVAGMIMTDEDSVNWR